MEVSVEMRKGPWSSDEDSKLIHSISILGQGRWDSLAHFAGLKRSGKSCRLRWLNYLRPNLRRGKITPQEQLLILLLHFRFGNRWSKIAENLAGRSDNDVKNYWRTKVQKHAKKLHCDVNSQQFRDFLLYQWLPSLLAQQIPPVMSSSSSSTTIIACPNVDVSSEDDIWNNNLCSFEDGSNISQDFSTLLPDHHDMAVYNYSSHHDHEEDHNYWVTSTISQILPDHETLCLDDDTDLWLFPY